MSDFAKTIGRNDEQSGVLWLGGFVIFILGCYGTYGFGKEWPEKGQGRLEKDAVAEVLQYFARGPAYLVDSLGSKGLIRNSFGLESLSPESQVVFGHRCVGFLAAVAGLMFGAGALEMRARLPRAAHSGVSVPIILGGCLLNLILVIRFVEALAHNVAVA